MKTNKNLKNIEKTVAMQKKKNSHIQKMNKGILMFGDTEIE